MTLSVAIQRPLGKTADDGLLNFNCPRCSRTVLRYHPDIRGMLQLQCPRTGVISKAAGLCRWKDLVYFNIQPEEVHRA